MCHVFVLTASAVVLAAVSGPQVLAQHNPGQQLPKDEPLSGRDLLDHLLQEDPKQVCKYIKCVAPARPEHCPPGSQYIKSIAQMGCCDACVQFMGNDEGSCCGGIEPQYAEFDGFCTKDLQQHPGCTLEVSGELVTLLFPKTRTQEPQVRNLLKSSRCNVGLCCNSRHECEADPQLASCQAVRDTHDSYVKSDHYDEVRDDYLWWPECSSDGKYAPKQCKGPRGEPKRCVCVDPEGHSIYGSAFDWQKELYQDMNCACSRRRWELQQAGERVITLHCKENGNYEELQCQKGYCFCMDLVKLKPHGMLLPEALMPFLPCYNKTVIGEQYLRRCESIHVAHTEALEYLAEHGVEGPKSVTNCDPDGAYGGLMQEKNRFYCVNKYGEKYDPPTANKDGCRCARDNALLHEHNHGTDLECASNSGAYEQRQVTDTRAFCVDADGVRTSPQVKPDYANNLYCNNAKMCQEAIDMDEARDFCPVTCGECPPDAYI